MGTDSVISPSSAKPVPQRDTLFDKMKGLGIILVVLGHLLQSAPDFDENFAFRLIYSFHMPLFFFISGYVLQLGLASKRISPGPFLTKKARSLVVPFLSWYLIFGIWKGLPPGLTLHDYVHRFLLSPDYGLWFLWVLFLCFLVFFPFVWLQQRLDRKMHPLLPVLSSLFFLGMWSVPGGHYGFGLLKIYYFYFGAGFFLCYWRKRIPAVILNWWPEICIIGFLFLVPYWRRTELVSFRQFLIIHFPRHANSMIQAFPFVVALLGIGSIAQIARGLGNGKAGNWVVWLGRYTLDIYVIHISILAYHPMSASTNLLDPLVLFVGIAWGVGTSIAISLFFIRRSRVLSFLFLGI